MFGEVIAAGPIMRNGRSPYRFVIRAEMDGDKVVGYVTHRQGVNLESGVVSFSNGVYSSVRHHGTRQATMIAAWKSLSERAGRDIESYQVADDETCVRFLEVACPVPA